MKAMERHKLKCQIFGTQATQCGSQLNTVRHQSANIRNERKIPQRKRGRRRVPRGFFCASASLQRGKDSRWHQKTGARRAQCQSKKTGKNEEKVANATKRIGKGSKNSSILHTKWRQRQWCLGRSEHIAPSYVWQNDVKASVYKAWQISPICRLLVEGAFVLNGTKLTQRMSSGAL